MFRLQHKGGKKQIRCWNARICGSMVLIMLYFPFMSGIQIAKEGGKDVFPLLILWGLGALSVLAGFKWEKIGGISTSVVALGAGIYIFSKYRSSELHLALIVTMLLLMSGILFLQCWMRKKMVLEKKD